MVHLHVHTMYSLLDAMIKPSDLADKLLSLGQNTIAITDHGNLYACVEFHNVLAKKGIKVINGCEVYICDNVNDKNKDNKYNHLILLCKNEVGRQNLNKLVSQSTLYKYYGKPRIDFEMLKKYHEGLICLSACMAGELSKAVENGDMELAKTVALKYKELFGDDYYIEYQAHSNEKQQKLNGSLIMLAKSLNIEYVVTCDAHYLNKDDQKYHSVFIQINSNRDIGETYDDCYIQSEDEVCEKCWLTQQYNKQAIENTHVIAEKCENTIPLSAPIIPHVDVPKQYSSEAEYLKHLCNQGFRDKGFSTWTYEDWDRYLTVEYTDENENTVTARPFEFNTAEEVRRIYIERAKYEMNALIGMGFEGYYLLVHSYVNSAVRRGIARGSGGGSLLAYLIGIVDIDPIKYGLYFERFIDVGALELLKNGTITKRELKIPDFDVDFSPTDRDKVMQFIIDRYHDENVVSLGQFSYIWAKGTIKDIGKVLDIPFETRNEITKKLDNETIEEALERGLFDEYKDQYPTLFEYASKLAGLPKAFGVHPCGKCVCTRNADYYNAVEFSESQNVWVLQGDMHTADALGLVKIDLLGLRTLDVIYDVLDMIGKGYDYIAPHKINLNDTQVWCEFAQGNTDCIFQFESSGMKKMLHDMKCNTLENLSAANALYRPGSKDYITNYVNRKNKKETFGYLHPDLEPILQSSYGIIIYQEQLIEIGRLAKLRNPDEIRKATAKKKPELMAKIEPELKSGLQRRGWTQEQTDILWSDILKFAKYSFNKSHSSAYALTAYIGMYLKVHHTAEFFSACINSYVGDIEQIAKSVNEARRMGVEVVLDDWKNVKALTYCQDGQIHLGTTAIKGCGAKVAETLHDLGCHIDMNFVNLITAVDQTDGIDKSQFEILIKLNFFNEFGERGKLLGIYRLYCQVYKRHQFDKNNCPIEVEIIKQFSKETDKQYRQINSQALFDYLCQHLSMPEMSICDIINTQREYLGWVDYVNPNYSKYIAMALEVDTKYSPRVKAYCLKNGKMCEFKIHKNKGNKSEVKTTYYQLPLNTGDMFLIKACKQEPKCMLVNGKWVKDYTSMEWWLNDYSLLT